MPAITMKNGFRKIHIYFNLSPLISLVIAPRIYQEVHTSKPSKKGTNTCSKYIGDEVMHFVSPSINKPVHSRNWILDTGDERAIL